MKMNKIAAALCATAVFSAPAFAGTVTFDFTPVGYSLTDLAAQLSIQKFDASLGTLTSIELIYSSDVKSSVTVTNNGRRATDVTVGLDATLSLYRPDSTLVAPAVSSSLYNSTFNLARGASKVVEGEKTLTVDATLTGASDLALFTGTGYVSSPFSVKAVSSGTSGSGLLNDFATQANGYGKVVYTFTAAPVPEPETYAMLLGGLALIGAIARRRKSA